MQHPPLAKRLKRFLRYVLIRVALALVYPLPLGLARWVGLRLGTLAFLVAGGERRKALKSLARAFPEKSDAERHALARACFRHLAAAAFEVGCTAALDRHLEALVTWPEADRRVLESWVALLPQQGRHAADGSGPVRSAAGPRCTLGATSRRPCPPGWTSPACRWSPR